MNKTDPETPPSTPQITICDEPFSLPLPIYVSRGSLRELCDPKFLAMLDATLAELEIKEDR
jgi:hypothetical protein